jgi:hypothetical protein
MDDQIAFVRRCLDAQHAALIAYRHHRADPTNCDNWDVHDSCSGHIRTAEATEYRDADYGLADIEAKRRILDLHSERMPGECDACNERQYGYPCPTVRLLAQPYAGRDGWQPEWATTPQP